MSTHEHRAKVLLDNGRYDLAEKELHQALAEAPDNAYLHRRLAYCLCNLQRFEEGLTEAVETLRLDPEDAGAHSVHSWALAALDYLPEAEQAIREALQLNPSFSGYYEQLAEAQRRQRMFAQALDTVDMGLRLDPEDLYCLNQRALCLFYLSRRQEAYQTLTAALRIDPEHAQTHTTLGIVFASPEDRADRIRCYREALRLRPSSKWLADELRQAVGLESWELVQRHQPREALQLMHEAARADPENPWVAIDYGNLLNEAGRSLIVSGGAGPAVDAFEHAAALFPDSLDDCRQELLRHLHDQARYLLEHNNPVGLDCLRQALRIDPGLQHMRWQWARGLTDQDCALLAANTAAPAKLARIRAALRGGLLRRLLWRGDAAGDRRRLRSAPLVSRLLQLAVGAWYVLFFVFLVLVLLFFFRSRR